MAHAPFPFFKAARNTWYVEVDRVQHKLGLHPAGLPEAKKVKGRWQPPEAVLTAFYKKMAELQGQRSQPQAEPAPVDSVVGVIERYLDWCGEHRKPATYEWYRWRLQMFADHVGASLTMAQLKHFHIDEWLKKHPDWSPGTKHGMARTVMRSMRWAKRKGYIDANPVADYEKARPGKRSVVVSPEVFADMLRLAGCDEFKDLLAFTWETAARPQETLVAEARHVDLENCRLVFPPDESKGEQWPRIVYLTDDSSAIVRRLMLSHPEGPLFRNSDGLAWTTDAVNCAFNRLRLRMGVEKMKRLGVMPPEVVKPPKKERRKWGAPQRKAFWADRKKKLAERKKLVAGLASQQARKYCLYHLRHSWLDRALKRGVDALTAAILMGHRDPSTISRVYQHLSQSPDFLRQQARKAVS